MNVPKLLIAMKSYNLKNQKVGYTYTFAKLLTIFSLLIISFSVYSQVKAFPNVQGAGSNVTGGRGGIVVKVTNLNNSGTGSFRSALMMTEPRIIVFDVSGTIVLTSSIELILENSNFTVAGQTAPEGGITISNHYIQMGGGYFRPAQSCNNAIWRYIRFRNGRYNGEPDVREHNGLISTGSDGLIFDHCSFSFCDDQALSLGGDYGKSENMTIQKSIFSENATQIIVGLNHPFDTGKLTFIQNAFIDTSQRTPNMGGNTQYDIINNYYFNWVGRLSNINAGSPEVNFIGNYMQEGTYTTPGSGNKYQTGNTTIYTANNYHSSLYTEPQLDDRNIWQEFFENGPVSASRFTTTMHPLLNDAIPNSALNVPNILNDIGANKYLNSDGTFGIYSDSFDITKISNAQNNISSDPQNKNWTLPILPSNTRSDSYDTDNDGMADNWEANIFGDLSKSAIGDEDSDGYTNIEEFINGTDPWSNIAFQVVVGDDLTICSGESVILTAANADSYLWMPGNITEASFDINPTINTTYTVTGTHSDGTTTDAEIVITVNQIPIANAGNNIETCAEFPVTLTASGGTSYLWNTGQTTEEITINPTITTTYTVEVFEDNCSSTDQVTVTVNEIPNIDAGENQTIFDGETAILTATGADSYLWSTGETTQSISVNPQLDTSYSVTGTTNNCQSIDTVTVFLADDSINANAGADTVVCIGQTTTLLAVGGTSYLWNTGETSASINVAPTETTTYTVTAFSLSGNNFEDDSVIVTVNEIPVANAGEDTSICFGNITTLTASGGVTYLWSNGQTTQSISVNPTETTTYTVEVFENNCSSIDQAQVTVNALPETNAGNDISITEGATTILTASGADSYAWNTGETTSSITVSPNTITTYTVTGANSNGCEFMDEVIVTIILDDITANAGVDIAICNGESTTLTASGGASYLWNTGESTAAIEVSPLGTTIYTVTAYSISGNNTDEDSVEVTVNEIPAANAGDDISICFGNGTTLTASGGTTYLWSTGQTTETIAVNPNNTTIYTVEVFENNCSSVDQIQVTVNELPETNAGNNVSIFEGDFITLTASGADSYVWSTSETSASISVSPNSTTIYTVTGTNSNGCEFSDSVIVSVETEFIDANAGTNVAICNGESISLIASGGASYLWSTGQTTATIVVSPLATTTYTVTVFSSNGTQSDDDSVTVIVNEIPIANAGNNVTACFGNVTTLTASGGTTYLWSTGETTQVIMVSPNITTTYTVEVFANNCSSTDDITITVNNLPETNAGNDVTITEGDATALTATGAASYIWSTGETTSSISVNPMVTTTYTITGMSNGCESIDQVIVTVEPFIFIASAGSNQTICQGYETTLTASDGDSYLWSTGETAQSIVVQPTNTQIYTVTVFDGVYQDDAAVEVSVNPNPNVVIANGVDVMILEGEFITLSASGANAYAWDNGAIQPNISVSPSNTTTYEVTGFINSCEDTKAIIVNVLEIVQADAGEDVFICDQEIVVLSANGGDAYLWNTGEITQTIEVAPNEDTAYSVLVYNALDSDEDTVTVFVEECSSTVEIPNDSDAVDFMIYQDPNTNILKVKIDGLQTITATGYSIYDLTGKILYTETFNQSEMEELSQMTRELDVSMYSRGLYVVQLIYNDTSLIKKIPIK